MKRIKHRLTYLRYRFARWLVGPLTDQIDANARLALQGVEALEVAVGRIEEQNYHQEIAELRDELERIQNSNR